ncbi:MAG TPA: magnesium-transporting ATPase, partial [Acidimicrobiaceae bacterium]|nr:magnesium-transporting ATPase [Acidimicrobiaceae bacterium]
PFPFLPRQLTLIGSFSIGLPGFFLALAPNESLVRPGFLERVLRFSLPAGAVAGAVTYGLYEWVRRLDDISLAEARTAATMTLLAIGLTILILVSRPLKPWKLGLAAAMGASYALVMAIPFGRTYFELDLPTATAWYGVAAASFIGSIGVWAASRLFGPEATNRA